MLSPILPRLRPTSRAPRRPRRITPGFAAFLPVVSLLLAGPAQAADLSSNYEWQQVKTGGGGNVVGLVIHPNEPGLLYAKTDVGGGYRWDESTQTWTQLITADRLPSNRVVFEAMEGVEAFGIDPSDPDVVFVAHDPGSPDGVGQIYKSTDRGETWVEIVFPVGIKMEANGNGKRRERFGVDPNNGNVVYYGSRKQGLWRSTDGGDSFSQVTNGPSTTRNVARMIFDESSGLAANGRTAVQYVISSGEGVFRSSDGGASWSNISGGAGPDSGGSEGDAEISSDGDYFAGCNQKKCQFPY